MIERFKVYGDTNSGWISQKFESASAAKAFYEQFYADGGELLRVEIDGDRIDDIADLKAHTAEE